MLDASNEALTRTRMASVVHDGRLDPASRASAAVQSQAVEKNCVATGSDFGHAALN